MKIPIKSIKLRIYFQPSKTAVERLRPYIHYIKAGNLDKIPVRYRGIFNPVIVKKIDAGYLMVDGHHRIAIIEALGLSVIDVEIV